MQRIHLPPLRVSRHTVDMPYGTERESIIRRITEIAEQQETLSRELWTLRTTLNSYEPAGRLPNEILIEIFTQYASLKVFFTGPYSLPQRGWMKLMLVCKHWYQVACGTPMLWRTINVGKSAAWLNLCLARSAAALLNITFGNSVYTTNYEVLPVYSHIHILVPHMHRVRRLHFHHSPQTCPDSLLLHLRNGATALEKLSFALSAGWDSRKPSVDLHLFSQNFPRLRSIALVKAVTPKDSLLYINLHALDLHKCECALSFNEFVKCVLSAVNLERLSLTSFLRQFPLESMSASATGPARSSLPGLKILNLHQDPIGHISRFLSYAPLPETSLSLQADLGSTAHDNMTISLTDLLPSGISDDQLIPLVSKTTTVSLETYFKYVLSNEMSYVPSVPALALGFYSDTKGGTEDPWEGTALAGGLRALLRVFRPATHTLTTLHVFGEQSISATDWQPVFAAFPALETLKLNGWGCNAPMWDGLHAASRATGSEAERGPTACPRLRQVEYGDLMDIDDASLEAALQCLTYRRQRGTTLDELWITYRDYVFEDGELEALMLEYVPQLEELVATLEMP